MFRLAELTPSSLPYDPSKGYHLYVILKNGITIYSENLYEIEDSKQDMKDSLLGGALSAIQQLMKEISETENPLKKIEQEDFLIILEQGKHLLLAVVSEQDHEILREKMRAFLAEVENTYREILEEQVADTRVFTPIKYIVQNFFKSAPT